MAVMDQPRTVSAAGLHAWLAGPPLGAGHGRQTVRLAIARRGVGTWRTADSP